MSGVSIGSYRLGGSKGRPTGPPYLLPMQFSYNMLIKTNDWYYKPGNRASWARRSRPSGGGRGHRNIPGTSLVARRLGGSGM
jgi:hypothetical protein